MAVVLQRSGPVVSMTGVLPPDGREAEDYVAALQDISTQAGPYVLLVDLAMEIDLSDEQRRAQNLWYKADRHRIEAGCRACALVRRAADEEVQRMWQRLFRFPVLVTTSRAEAESFLARHVQADGVDVVHR